MRGATKLLYFLLFGLSVSEEQTCSWTNTNEVDPALQEFTYDVGDGPRQFLAYVEPDVSSFYREEAGSSAKVIPKFNGFAAKFINLSNKNVKHYWEGNGATVLMRFYTPFSSGGSASFPGHRFYFTPENEPEVRLQEWVIEEYPENILVYDPYHVGGDDVQTEANLAVLTIEERALYDMWRRTLSFHEQYRNFTGRSWLANYGRDPPKNFMWKADYFGQTHWVTTKETHFAEVPPANVLEPLSMQPNDRILQDSDARILSEYRVKDQSVMNMTLRVLSCAPRVFEIENFLSEAEIEHILELAGGINLKASTTGDVGSNSNERNEKLKPEEGTKTRTSFNSWIPRERSPVLDAIYRRSADLFRIDESLLRYRGADEHPEVPTKKATCESLQIVHYGRTQEYTSHHDFGYSNIDDPHNGARFATLLFYLNEEMTGGQTSFPRWVNAETFHGLQVTPKAGKAVLFYNQLPDGNLDDFSQHAAKPILDGEKWLINLWVWDPIYEA